MNRQFSSVLLLGVLSVVLAACGGGDGTVRSAATAAPASEAPAGTLFLRPVRGDRLVRVDVASGETKTVHLKALALGGDPPFHLVRTGGRLVLYGTSGGRPAAVAVEDDLTGRPRSLGEASYFVPSATDGHVWLALIDPASDETVKALGSVQEVRVDDGAQATALGPVTPPGRNLVGAVGDGLLFQDDGLELWNPQTREVTLRLPGPFPAATRENELAWCESGCPVLHITDVVRGTEVSVPPGEDFAFEETYDGAFSPDGALLAVPAVMHGEERPRVALVDVERRSAAVVPGSELGESRTIAWSSDGRWLFFGAGEGRIMGYRPGAPSAVVLPLVVDAPFVDMVAG